MTEDNDSLKKPFFRRFGASFQDAVQKSRGSETSASSLAPEAELDASANDLVVRRSKDTAPKRLTIPEGVTITGSVSGGTETEISGRVEGDVTVEGRLYLGPTALITGNVRAVSCKIECVVEGKVDCSQELEIGRTGRLNADAAAGRKITVAGQIYGMVTTGGVVRIVSSGKIHGNIQAKQIFIEEGAKFNGRCTMRPLADKKPVAPRM